MKQFYTAIILVIVFTGTAFSQTDVYKQIRISYPDETTLFKLIQLGIEPIFSRAGEYMDFAVDSADLQTITSLGIAYTVIHDDMTAFYQSRNPLGTTMGGYRTFDEMVAVMDSFAAAYPNFCTPKFSIATTEQGRSLWTMKVSDNPSVDEDEPEAFVCGIIHAREPIGGEIILEFMRFLFTQYGIDPVATNLINNYQIYFLPVINPDGYEYNRQIAPNGGGMWRKNRRNNWDGSYGVDLNRNFSYFWGYDDNGSSPSTGDETYRGPSYSSEPEVYGIQNFVNAHDFAILLNYHAYGNYFLLPWGYYDGECPDHTYYDTLSAHAQDLGYTEGTPWQLLYNTNGDIADWSYGEDRTHRRCFGTVVEVGSDWDGFWPPQNRITPLITENLSLLEDLMPRALDAYKRRLPQKPTVTSPPAAAPGSQFYLHWQRSNVDTFNLAASYRVTMLADYTRTYEIFESTTGYVLDGFTRNSAYRHSGTYSVYSGQGNNLRNYVTLTERVKVNQGDALTFWARYNIQAGYDYAYVQVSSDGGESWWEIDGNLSTSENPHRRNKGFGITGSSSGNWVLGNYPLSHYVGQEIKIRFAYWTDPTSSNEGIYIDDVYPSEIFGTSSVLAENTTSDSLLVGPYPIGQRWFKVESRDDRSQIGPPSNRFQVDIQGNVYNLSGHVALSDLPADLSGSIVTIAGTGLTDSTNSAGTYGIATVPEGIYFIIASHEGYYPDTVLAFGISSDTTLDFSLQLAPPSAPLLLAPPNNGTVDNGYVSFDWNDGPAIDRYIIEVASDQDFGNVILFDSSVAVSSYQNPQPFSNGVYFWRVTAHSLLGYSPRSSTWLFIVNATLSAPTLISPANGYLSDTSRISFDWSDVGGATRYIFEAGDSLFANIAVSDSNLVASSFAANFADGRYFWRVTAFNGLIYSSRSQVRSFTVLTYLAAPELLVPAEGFVSDSNRVDFDWGDIVGANFYIFEVSTDSNFTSHVINDSTHSGSSYSQAGPFTNGNYFWRVTASNGLIHSLRSGTRTFTVNVFMGYPAPILIAPGDGFVSHSAYVNFDWSDVLDTITYILEFSLNRQFDPIVFADSTIPVSNYTNIDPLGSNEYFWRVRATDGIHWSPYSDTWSVIIDVSQDYIAGDANNSGSVNGLDVVYLVNYFKGGGPPPVPYLAGDANGTCDVNGLDAVYLVNFFKGGPYPFRGNCLLKSQP